MGRSEPPPQVAEQRAPRPRRRRLHWPSLLVLTVIGVVLTAVAVVELPTRTTATATAEFLPREPTRGWFVNVSERTEVRQRVVDSYEASLAMTDAVRAHTPTGTGDTDPWLVVDMVSDSFDQSDEPFTQSFVFLSDAEALKLATVENNRGLLAFDPMLPLLTPQTTGGGAGDYAGTLENAAGSSQVSVHVQGHPDGGCVRADYTVEVRSGPAKSFDGAVTFCRASGDQPAGLTSFGTGDNEFRLRPGPVPAPTCRHPAPRRRCGWRRPSRRSSACSPTVGSTRCGRWRRPSHSPPPGGAASCWPTGTAGWWPRSRSRSTTPAPRSTRRCGAGVI